MPLSSPTTKTQIIMEINLTNSQINELSIRQINFIFRVCDESKKWPVCGKFNATERAIRRIARYRSKGLEIHPGLEYWLTLEREISDIVNTL